MKLRFPRFRFGIFTTLMALFLLIALVLFTPLSEIVMRLIPEDTHRRIFGNIYQEITLLENPGTLEKKISFNKRLPVLGTQSGVCLEFETGGLTIGQKNDAKRNKTIAETAAISAQGQKYSLTDTLITQNPKKNIIICQQLGRRYSLTPDEIIMLSIKPKESFTPTRIFWASTIDFFSFRPPEYRGY